MENLTIETFKFKIFDFENNQEWKYNGDLPSILVFSALGWCIPCQKLHPVLEDLSKEYEGKIHIYDVDVEEQQELSTIFNVKSVPTFLFIPINEEPKILVGGISKDKIKSLIFEVLKVQ